MIILNQNGGLLKKWIKKDYYIMVIKYYGIVQDVVLNFQQMKYHKDIKKIQ